MAEPKPPIDETLPLEDEPRPPGRPLTYTPELGDKICAAVGAGVPLSTAARYAQVDPETAQRWVDKGKELGQGPLWEFSERVAKLR